MSVNIHLPIEKIIEKYNPEDLEIVHTEIDQDTLTLRVSLD